MFSVYCTEPSQLRRSPLIVVGNSVSDGVFVVLREMTDERQVKPATKAWQDIVSQLGSVHPGPPQIDDGRYARCDRPFLPI